MIETNKVFRKIVFRLKVNRFVTSFFIALLLSFIIGFFFILLSKLISFHLFIITIFEAVFIASIFYAILNLLISKVTSAQVALMIDKKLGLKERVYSALLLEKTHSPFTDALKNDANNYLENIESGKSFPIKIHPSAKYIFVPIILSLFIYSLLPDYDLFKLDKKRELARVTKATIAQEAKLLEKQSVDLDKKLEKSQYPEIKKASDDMKKLSTELQKKDITKKEAILKISQLSDKLQKAKDKLAKSEKLSNDINQTSQFDKLRKLASEFKKKDYESASKILSELSKKLKSGEISQEDLEKITSELSKLSKLMGNKNPLKADLMNAAQSLDKKELLKAVKELEKASKNSCEMGCKMQNEMANLAKMLSMLEKSQMSITVADSQLANKMSAQEKDGNSSNGCNKKGKDASCTSCENASGPEAGIGTTNEEADPYKVEKFLEAKDRFSKDKSRWQEEFIKLHKPMRLAGSKTDEQFLKGDLNLQKGIREISTPLEPAPVMPETEVKEVLSEYTKMQKDSIEREEVPNYYKNCVQNYFDSIQ